LAANEQHDKRVHLIASTQHAHQIVPAVPPRAAINQVLLRDGHQAERVIEFAIGQQACIGGDAGTVELQLEAAVEIEPESIGFGFTRWLRHPRPRSQRDKMPESYSSIGISADQFNRSSG
jgi:hypothetical protein